jgi:hypothetical protein
VEAVPMPEFVRVVEAVARRPGLYVGRCSLSDVGHYLSGYACALADAGQAESPIEGWMRWVELRYLIAHPAWHWTRILLYVHGTDRAALDALPGLYRQFLADRTTLGIAGIEAELSRRLIAAHGEEWYEPST